MWMWHLGTWFGGGLGSVTLVVGLHDLKGLFQPKWFYDSMTHSDDSHQFLSNGFKCSPATFQFAGS